MKVKIKSLQGGGGFATFTPIIHTPPVPQTAKESTDSEATGSSASSIVDSKMIEHLYKTGGLVNDVNKLVSELIQLEKSSDLPYLKSQNRSSALQIVAKINEINQNKLNWDDAITRSKEAGGLGEVAVDTYGRVFTKTKDNKIQSLSLKEYSSKKDSIKLLSVQELMFERQYNNSLTGQNDVFTVADNAIGLNKITDHIKSLISALGTETTDETKFYAKEQTTQYLKEMGLKKPTAEEQGALTMLRDIVATPGEYASVKTKVASERNQIGKALNYIWDTLGEPAQQKLAVTAVMNGVKNPKQFILDMLESQTDYSTETTITPKELPGKTTSDKAAKDVALSPQEIMYSDKLYKPGMFFEINNPKAGATMKVTATAIGPLWNLRKEGEVVGASTITKVLVDNNYMAIVNPQKAYIGDQRVDPQLMREVAFTGEDIGKVYLPVKSDGSPDLSEIESFNRAYQQYEANKDKWTKDQIESYFSKAGFPRVKISEVEEADGTLTKIIAEGGPVKPFLALPVITNSASELSANPWMLEMIGTQKAPAKRMMKEAFTITGGTPSKPKSNDTSPSAFFAFEYPYKGVMFISFRPEANAILSSMQRNVRGRAVNEEDISRNSRYSSATAAPGGVQASADVL